jgi:autotransporter-associated beta strand protein
VNIGAGKTLAISSGTANPITVGLSPQGLGTSTTTNVNFTGSGTLQVNSTGSSTYFAVGVNGYNPGNYGNASTMDLSGLSALYATVGELRVGYDSSAISNTRTSTLILAPTSTVTATKIDIGASDQTGVSYLKLGSGSNTLNATTINLGVPGGGPGTGNISFYGSDGSLTIRGKTGGISAVTTMTVGQSTSTVGADLTNTFDTTGHSASIKVGTLIMATSNPGSGTIGWRRAYFLFDEGDLTIDTATLAAKGSTGAVTAGKSVAGTMTLGGGTVTFTGTGGNGTAITLAKQTSTGANANAVGTLNITGTADVAVKANIIDFGGTTTTTLNLDGGTLDMWNNSIGNGTNPIDVLTLASGTLKNVNQINGGADITKTTSGTLIMGGTNTYTGATIVSAGTLALAAASTNNIASSPTIHVAGGAILNVTGLSGGAIALASGQTLKGGGTVNGGVTVANGSFVSPGASPGSLAIIGGVTTTWEGGGHYTWEVNQVDTANQAQTAYKGLDPGHDWLNITGALNITGTSSSKFNLDVTGLDLTNVQGIVVNWDKTKSYDWTIASASGGITGFDANAFSLNTGNFTNNNDIGTGTFSILQNSNDIVLHFAAPGGGAPVPVLAITTADHVRVLKNTNFGVSGNVTNAAGTADFTNAALADNGGQLTASGFNPAGAFTVAYPSGNQAFTASVAAGSTTGSRTYSIKADNGTYSASDTKNLDVVEARTLTPAGAVTFAVHAGATGSGSTNVTSTTDDHATVADVTLAAGADNGFTITSNGAAFVGGASNPTATVTISKTFATAGTQTGTVTLSGGNGLTPEMTGGANNLAIGYTVQVFTGQAKWASSSNSSWAADANWIDTGSTATAGAPGVSALPGVYDTATFDATATQKSVNLEGAAPHLSAITFDGAAKYTIAQGTGGGTLHMDNGGSPATITLLSGSHTISAPMSIDSDTSITGVGSLVEGGDIANAARTLSIGTSVEAGNITGNGTTQVSGSLTVDSILQGTLTISAGATVTLRPTTAGAFAGGPGNLSQVPEPGTWALLLSAAAAAAAWTWQRRKRAV